MQVNESLVTLASQLFLGAFVAYLIASLLYVPGYMGYRMSQGKRFGGALRLAPTIHLIGLVLHAGAIIARWQGVGHWPTSNMYEFIGFLSFTTMLAFQVLNRMYDIKALGVLVAPLGAFLMAYAYVFPRHVAPLVPALKSYWMPLHVSMAALGEGFFAVAFGAALMYLLRVRGLELKAEEQTPSQAKQVAATVQAESISKASHIPLPTAAERKWGVRGLEFVFYLAFVFIGFTILAASFRHTGHEWIFDADTYHLPPIIGPAGEGIGTKEAFGVALPVVEVPNDSWRAKNTNTMLYSLVAGYLLYAAVRLMTRGPISNWLARRVGGNAELYDEVSYRAVAIGYPVFTLGALVFAMLWAKEAWGRYWFFDPKETWALISWLVYSVYLHARVSQGWEGRKSAWIAVIGFGVVLFTFIGVNLLIVGLHSYAGGDS